MYKLVKYNRLDFRTVCSYELPSKYLQEALDFSERMIKGHTRPGERWRLFKDNYVLVAWEYKERVY